MNTERLSQFISEGRLIRGKWVGADAQGRETACLLAALSPEVASSKDPSKCPASLMPLWLAHLTPSIDDNGSIEKWPDVIKRYADLAGRWHILTEKDWARAEYKVKRVALKEAMKHTDDKAVLKVCTDVLILLDRASNDDIPTTAEFKTAAGAAAGGGVG